VLKPKMGESSCDLDK